MTVGKKYELGYSAGALLSNAFEVVVENCDDLSKLSEGECNVHYSVIQANAESSQKRYLLEILKRLKSTPTKVLEMYKGCDVQSQRVIEFFAVCNTYSIIQEFMIEIVRNKWLNLDFELDSHDFKSFLLNKLSQTDSIDQVSDLSVNKLTQVALKMLKELGLYNGKSFKKIEINPSVLKIIHDSGNEWFLDVMLLTEEEKNEVKQW